MSQVWKMCLKLLKDSDLVDNEQRRLVPAAAPTPLIDLRNMKDKNAVPNIMQVLRDIKLEREDSNTVGESGAIVICDDSVIDLLDSSDDESDSESIFENTEADLAIESTQLAVPIGLVQIYHRYNYFCILYIDTFYDY